MIPRSLHDCKEVTVVDIGVYSALCYFSNKDGVCWPSCKSIAEKAKVSEATVRRALKQLVKEGYLTIDMRLDNFGRNTSNIYHLNLNKLNDTLPLTTDTLPCQNDTLPFRGNNDEEHSNGYYFKKLAHDTLPPTTDTLPPTCDRQNYIHRTRTIEQESKTDTSVFTPEIRLESAKEFVARVYGEVQDTYEARQQIIMMQAIFDLADTMPEKQRDRAMLCELNSEMIDLYEAIDVSVLTGIISKIITHQKDPNGKWNKGKPYVNIKRTLIDWFNREARHGT